MPYKKLETNTTIDNHSLEIFYERCLLNNKKLCTEEYKYKINSVLWT